MMTIIQFLLVSFLIMRLIHLRGYTHYAAAIDYNSVSMGTNNTFQEKSFVYSVIFSQILQELTHLSSKVPLD